MKDFSKFGRVNYTLKRRLELLAEVQRLAESIEVEGVRPRGRVGMLVVVLVVVVACGGGGVDVSGHVVLVAVLTLAVVVVVLLLCYISAGLVLSFCSQCFSWGWGGRRG